MQTVYRISEHFLGEGSKFKDFDYLTFVSKASTEIGVLRSCARQLSKLLKKGQLYFIDFFDNGEYFYFCNAFYTGKSFIFYSKKKV